MAEAIRHIVGLASYKISAELLLDSFIFLLSFSLLPRFLLSLLFQLKTYQKQCYIYHHVEIPCLAIPR